MDKRLKYLMGWLFITGLFFKLLEYPGADDMFLVGSSSLLLYYIYKVIQGLVLKSSKLLILKYFLGVGFGLSLSMLAGDVWPGAIAVLLSWTVYSIYSVYRLIKG